MKKKNIAKNEILKVGCENVMASVNALCSLMQKYNKQIAKLEAENADLRKAME